MIQFSSWCRLRFELYAQALYESIGSPVVNSENVWDIYRQLIHRFEHLDEAMEFMEECQVFLSIWDDHDEVGDRTTRRGGASWWT